jgi:hypothetical protein
MGLLDDLVTAFVDAIDAIPEALGLIGDELGQLGDFLDIDFSEFAQAIESSEDPTEDLAVILNTLDVSGDAGDVLVDTVEEFLLVPLEEEGQLTPDNVEGALDELEGNAAAVTAAIIGLTLSIETLSAGQIDEVPSEIFQSLAGLGFQDVVGREVDARLQEGVDPALKQKVHRETRSKQVNFQDFADANVRSKRFGGNVETIDGDLPDGLLNLLHPQDTGYLSDPDTYGIYPDQTEILELVGLGVSEPEEIIEEPIQYGIPVPLRPVEALNDLQGFPEDVKTIYRAVIDALPRTENLIQDYARLAEFNFRLREKVQDDALTPVQARKLIEPELRDVIQDAMPQDRYREKDRDAEEVVDILAGELERNFKLLSDLPADPPSQSQLESWYQKGVISGQEFARLYDEYGSRPQDFLKYAVESAVDAGWERIQRQYALNRISASDAERRLQDIGYTAQEAQRILAGGNGNDIANQRLQGQDQTAQIEPAALINVGQSRQQSLRLSGIESVGQVAQLDVEQLTALTGMTDQEARETLTQASQAVAAAGSDA